MDKPNASQLFSAQLAEETVRRTDKLGKENVELAIQLKQAREFLEWSAHHMRKAWLDWVDESHKASQEIIAFRMAFERENKTIVASGKDVKDFFGSGEYQHAQEKLKEMLDCLERFKQLKADGTLDAFADFILKVQK